MNKEKNEKKKGLDWIENELRNLENWLDTADPLTDDYDTVLKRYRELVETREKIKDGKNKRSLFPVLLEASISAATGIGVPLALGHLSYKNDQDLNLKNGSIWGLIGKKFDTFKLPDKKTDQNINVTVKK